MINDATSSQHPARPPQAPRLGFDVHVLQDTHHADDAGLRQIGETAYRLAGFRHGLTTDEIQQTTLDPLRVVGEPGLKDMRSKVWSAIDNRSSKDPDQISVAERIPDGNIKIYVAAADVDELVSQDSPVDQLALDNMTSVYTDLDTYNMLPKDFCNNKTVLLQGQDRAALVTEMIVTPQGEIKEAKVYRALVNNHSQLCYDDVDEWFGDNSKVPDPMQGVGGMAEQLQLQDEAAAWMEAGEKAAGRAPVHSSAKDHAAVVDGRPAQSDRAQRLVEMQMRAVNRISAQFLLANGSPALVRAREVTAPVWDKIVHLAADHGTTLPGVANNDALQGFLDGQKKADKEVFPALQKQVSNLLGPPRYTVAVPGHEHELFTLGSPLSARITGPNRLDQDLVNQRMIKAILSGQPCPYQVGVPGTSVAGLKTKTVTLHQIADKASRIERQSIAVMRQVQNSMAAFSMQEQIARVFMGKVSGHNSVGSFVSLDGTRADGFVHEQLEKGQIVKVRLDSVDIEKGRIALSVLEAQPLPSDPRSEALEAPVA